MPDVNLILKMEPEFHWWGVRMLTTLPDSDLSIKVRTKRFRKAVVREMRKRLREACDLRWWQRLTFRIVSKGALLTKEQYDIAVVDFRVRQFEGRSK